MTKTYIAENLKVLRELHNLSQVGLSKRLDVGKNTVLNYEKGHYLPTLEFLIKLSSAFNVNIHDFIFKKMIPQRTIKFD